MKAVRLLCYTFLLAFDALVGAQPSIAFLILLTNKNVPLIYSLGYHHVVCNGTYRLTTSICEQKTKDCASSGSSQHKP